MAGIGLLVVYIGAWGNVFMAKGWFTSQQMEAIKADAEMLVLIMSTNMLQPFLVALFFTGVMGAIVSSADSALFAPATIISNDIVRNLFIKAKKPYADQDLTTWTQIAVAGLGVAATLLGAVTVSVFDLMVIGFTLQAVLFFPLTFALYWKGANKTGAVAGMITGMTLVLGFMLSQGTISPEPYWVLVFMPMGVGCLVQLIVSRLTARSDPPLPLTHADGSIISWPDLAKNVKQSI